MLFDREQLAISFVNIHYEYTQTITKLIDLLCSLGGNGVLYQLYKHNDALTSGDLAKYLDITSGRLANILKQLENKKYIIRTRSDIDKRITLVSLTNSGKEETERIYNRDIEIYQRLFGALSDKELLELRKLSLKLFDEIKAIDMLN